MKRVGIVGAGLIGNWHASRWKQLPVELAGYYDRIADRAEATAQEYGGRAFASLDEFLEAVDVVDVCTPTYEHKEPVLAAAQAGKDIVCEKPLARHVADAEAMIAACRSAGVRLFVAQVVRFFPEFVQAKAVLDGGALGKPGVVRTIRGGNYPRPETWYGDFERSGGVILDLAIHDIDYLRWCFGDVQRVFARGLSFAGIKATDHALITLRFANGVIGHVEGSWAFPAGIFRTFLEVAGDQGLLHFDSLETSPLTVSLHQDAAAAEGAITIPGSPLAPADDAYYRELEHFLHCLDSGEDFRVSPQDALEALRVALAAIESERSGRPVELATFKEAAE